MMIEGEALHAVPYGGVSEAELAVLRNNEPVNQQEAADLTNAVLRQGEIEALECADQAAEGGQGPAAYPGRAAACRAARSSWRHATPNRFNMPHHCYEYHNTLAWFFDNFDHPRRLRLLYVAALFANRVAYNQQGLGEVHPVPLQAPSGASA